MLKRTRLFAEMSAFQNLDDRNGSKAGIQLPALGYVWVY
jgi:hypothetical protein